MYDYIKKPLLRKGAHEDMDGFGKRIMQDYVDRPDMYYSRHFVYRNEYQLQRFVQDVADVAAEIRRRTRTCEWRRNHEACFNFNSECPYAKICHCEQPDKITLEMYFKRRETDDEVKNGASGSVEGTITE